MTLNDRNMFTNNRYENIRPAKFTTPCINKSQIHLNNTLRMLWEQHVFWTRLDILSLVFGLPDEKFVAKRLLRNPKDFQPIFRYFYGDRIAFIFTNLFTSHLVIAAELIKASKAGNNLAALDAEKKWYANADEIATFFSSINPFWSAQNWKSMMYTHLSLTKSEAVFIMSSKYQEGINVFDQIEKEAIMMADVMTSGIAKQFPNMYF